MPLFVCENCGTVDNTALTNFWMARYEARQNGTPFKPLCSACDKGPPSMGVWHGRFPARTMEQSGYVFLKQRPFVGKKEWDT